MTDSHEHSPQSPLATVTNIATARNDAVMQKGLEVLAKNLDAALNIYLASDLARYPEATRAVIKDSFIVALKPVFTADGKPINRITLGQRFTAAKALFDQNLATALNGDTTMHGLGILFKNICGQMEAKISFGSDAQRASVSTTAEKGC